MNRNLNLPAWGPYSKHYIGISKIINTPIIKQMLDFIPLLGFFRGKTIIPDVNYDCGYHVWECAPDYSYLSVRFDLDGKDRQFALVSFFPKDEGCIVEVTFENHTRYDREYFLSLTSVQRIRDIRGCEPPEGSLWIGGEDYDVLDYRPPMQLHISGENYEAFCHLDYLGMGHDGLKRGVTIDDGLTDGVGLGNLLRPVLGGAQGTDCNRTFLMNRNTRILYSADGNEYKYLTLRVLSENITRIGFEILINEEKYYCSMSEKSMRQQTDGFYFICVELKDNTRVDKITLAVDELTASDSPAFVLDGILLSNTSDCAGLFSRNTDAPHFTTTHEHSGEGAVLQPSHLDDVHIALFSPNERPLPPQPYSDCTLTHIYHHELSGVSILRKLNNDSLLNWGIHNTQIIGDRQNEFCGYNIAPIFCAANSSRTCYAAIVCKESSTAAEAMCIARRLYNDKDAIIKQACDSYFEYRKRLRQKLLPSAYEFSQQKLEAHLYFNITYPIYVYDGFYKTYTPGKRWGGLYTWDSGMLGIGLAEYKPSAALEIIRQYFIDASDSQTDAVLHGTQLPLHIYLMQVWYQLTLDNDTLAELYPAAKKYYRYFAGLSELSTYDKFKTGLLCPFEDGYNAEGIDDYPPQHAAGLNGYYPVISPVCTSAHAVRCGKIMRIFARILGFDSDADEYSRHIDYMENALNRYAWDEKSGYYSYVIHPSMEKFTYDDGENKVSYNMGVDGLSPLVAGCMNDKQLQAAVVHLTTRGHMWTEFGITAVDMRAPYAREDGYWNGKVWIPHQWLFWKALITEGVFDKAAMIARTALNVYKNSTEDSFNSYELYSINTGMGEGCHNFGGLSAPLTSFYFAYHCKGRITPGYDTIVDNIKSEGNRVCFTAFTPYRATATGLIYCIPEPHNNWRVEIDSHIQVISCKDGVLDILLPPSAKPLNITAEPV